MSKILLVDTGFSALPIYDALLAGGHEVWSVSGRAGDAISRRCGERWIDLNYSNVPAVQAILDRHRFDAVVPGCTDVSYATCVELSAFRNCDGREVNYALNNKRAFREICAQLGIPSPLRLGTTEFPRAGAYICKPVDSFSGRGVTRFDGEDTKAMSRAADIARAQSPAAEVLFETFVEGQLYSFSCFLEGRRVVERFLVEEWASVNPYAVDTSHVIFEPIEQIDAALRRTAEALAGYLDLSDGLLHLQFIVESGAPYLIEATRRCPGDLYSLLIEYSTGYPYAARYASAFTGDDCLAQPSGKSYVVRHTLASELQGVNQGIVFTQPITTRAVFPLQTTGDVVLSNQNSRLGILFAQCGTSAERDALSARLIRREAYRGLE